jgi:hypothetical protein
MPFATISLRLSQVRCRFPGAAYGRAWRGDLDHAVVGSLQPLVSKPLVLLVVLRSHVMRGKIISHSAPYAALE